MSKRKIAYARKTCIDPEEEGEQLPFPPRDIVIHKDYWFDRDYDLSDELLGRGKFGEVKKCVEKSTGLELAAKIINSRKESDREDVRKEITIMSKLRHPKILQIYDAFESSRRMCIITELVEGGELFDRIIDEDFDLTERVAILFMRQIVDGVSFIHSQNILHLDLKPENIICVAKTGTRIKIIDFGLAMRYNSFSSVKVMAGTIDFMAPEVCNYEDVTPATDLWSVGVICYVLVSGLSPFSGDDDSETICNILRVEYDFAADEFDEITAGCKDFIKKLLVKQPKKRMTAEDCLKHSWLNKITRSQTKKHLSKKHHIKFFVRRKWKKVIKAVIALNRMKTLVKLKQNQLNQNKATTDELTIPATDTLMKEELGIHQHQQAGHVSLTSTARRSRVKNEGGSPVTPTLSCSSGYESSGSTRSIAAVDENISKIEEHDEEKENTTPTIVENREFLRMESEDTLVEELMEADGILSNTELYDASIEDSEDRESDKDTMTPWSDAGIRMESTCPLPVLNIVRVEATTSQARELSESASEEEEEQGVRNADVKNEEPQLSIHSPEKKATSSEESAEPKGVAESNSEKNRSKDYNHQTQDYFSEQAAGSRNNELLEHSSNTGKDLTSICAEVESKTDDIGPGFFHNATLEYNEEAAMRHITCELPKQKLHTPEQHDMSTVSEVHVRDKKLPSPEDEIANESGDDSVTDEELISGSGSDYESDEHSNHSSQKYCPMNTLDRLVSRITSRNNSGSSESSKHSSSNRAHRSSRQVSHVSKQSTSGSIITDRKDSSEEGIFMKEEPADHRLDTATNSGIRASQRHSTSDGHRIRKTDSGSLEIPVRHLTEPKNSRPEYSRTKEDDEVNKHLILTPTKSRQLSSSSRGSLTSSRKSSYAEDGKSTHSSNSSTEDPPLQRNYRAHHSSYDNVSAHENIKERQLSCDDSKPPQSRRWSPKVSASPVREMNSAERRKARIAAICGEQYTPPSRSPPPEMQERVIPIEIECSHPSTNVRMNWSGLERVGLGRVSSSSSDISYQPNREVYPIRGRVSHSPLRSFPFNNYSGSSSARGSRESLYSQRDSESPVRNGPDRRRARIAAIIGEPCDGESVSSQRPPVNRVTTSNPGSRSTSRSNTDEARHRRIANILMTTQNQK